MLRSGVKKSPKDPKRLGRGNEEKAGQARAALLEEKKISINSKSAEKVDLFLNFLGRGLCEGFHGSAI